MVIQHGKIFTSAHSQLLLDGMKKLEATNKIT